ncbi:MAG TPA: hypothetical protein VFS08_09695 [Gemmatimonadaceae bacterium]|nr:hypothetical protein [Gemmatimonadaceae bacterium]
MSTRLAFHATTAQPRAARRDAARDAIRDAARDPRAIPPFPHGRVAAAVATALLVVVLLAGFRSAPADVAASTGAARGLCFGHLDMFERVAANATDRWEICFRRGGAARVRVVGDGHTNLDCVVAAPSGRVVARSEEAGDLCVLEWRPRENGNHRLEIRNRGALANAYRLVTR